MRIIVMVAILFLSIVGHGLAQSVLHPKTEWTIAEVKEWAEKQKEIPTWHGWLLYQGSDSLTHHFISRVMDEWAWFNIKRADLKITDERIYYISSSGQLGYYYVDATKDFVKIREY